MGFPDHRCEICGSPIIAEGWGPPYQYICCSECFHAKFWDKYAAMVPSDLSDGRMVVRAGGRHFVIAHEPDNLRNKGMLGFGGALWVIHIWGGPNADRLVVTHNLWAQGEIPLSHRKVLPDNATILRLLTVLEQRKDGTLGHITNYF